MEVLAYQLFIIMTLVLTRIFFPNRLVAVSCIWTGLTLINLFWPPLIVVQLIVIWGTFGLLQKSNQTPDAGASTSGNAGDGGSTVEGFVQASSTRDRDQPAPLSANSATLFSAIQQGANALATAADQLARYTDRQKQIQGATSALRVGYHGERLSIESALESAERGLKLDTDPELRKLYEKNLAMFKALPGGSSDASTSGAPSENLCVDFNLPLRHRDPEISAAVERIYTSTTNDYSIFLSETIKRLQREKGLRTIFENEMLSSGGAQILKRIKSFEAGQEWKNAVTAQTVAKSASQTLINLFATVGQPTKGNTTTDTSSIDMLTEYIRKAREQQEAVSNHARPQLAPDHVPSAALPPVASTSREQPGAQAPKSIDSNKAKFVAPSIHPQQDRSLPFHEREKIKKTAVALQIPALYHFTRRSNLESILKHGLCSRLRAVELAIKPHVNDGLRLDGHPDAVSLSIAFPNHLMFYRYRQIEPAEEWVILTINPAILWGKNCAFCERNASDHRIRERPLADLMNASAFHSMFGMIDGIASREDQRLMDYDPTDPQAEVLVFETIEPNQIEGIGFDSHKLLGVCSHLIGHRLSKVFQTNKGPFGARSLARKATN